MKTSTLSFETTHWDEVPEIVLAGVDEAGRGCLAGPVYAGAVSMPRAVAERFYEGDLVGLTDSKQLSESQRDEYFQKISEHPEIAFATGVCTAAEIDHLNILAATHLAMRRALEALPVQVGFALVDGLPVQGLPVPSQAIVKGDSKSFLIAAASVVAKVSRDRYMTELAKRYPQYGFEIHKGYGTKLHMEALFRYGATPEHRHTFRPVRDVEESLPGLFSY